MGRGGLERGKDLQQTDPAEHRLLGLPLVPCDGPRELRGSRNRRVDEPRLRQHHSGSRRAARSRRALPQGAASNGSQAWVAAHDVSYPRRRALLGRKYFPHEGQNGLPSFREVLEYVGDAYRSDPQGVAQKGRALIDVLMRRPPNGQRRATITDESAQTAAAEVLEQIDRKNGGLEGAPKFPYPAVFAFLWNQGLRSGRRDLCAAAGFTLERIAASGLHDHVGGGFFRYTVDAEWKIPHFEKMLYDNALLVSLYSELYCREAGALHRDLVRRTVEWLLGEMRVGDTAFASTLAAESEGREGAYYLLDPAEVASVLGDAAHEFRAQYLGSSADFEGGK